MTSANRKTVVGTVRTRRLGAMKNGNSLYAVEKLEGPPKFNKGDGYDSGRNMLGALLIGPDWRLIGYVEGRKGAWGTKRNSGGKLQGCYATVKMAAESLKVVGEWSK